MSAAKPPPRERLSYGSRLLGREAEAILCTALRYHTEQKKKKRERGLTVADEHHPVERKQ